MIIKRLTLNNFRQFIGKQQIDFANDAEKNVTVLIGINTSGKTTFVRAFEWILYGKRDFDDKILLNQNVVDNMMVGEVQEVTGTILLSHNGKDFEISRQESYTCISDKKVRATTPIAKIYYMQPDGQTKTEIGSDFSTNIESILPQALSGYFFFGGERVGLISSREDIEASVKGLMGLDVLFNAMNHLRTVINRLKKSMDYSGDDEAGSIQEKLDYVNQMFNDQKDNLQNLEEQLQYYRNEKTKYAALLKANEDFADMQKRREQLDSIINDLDKRNDRDKGEMISTFSHDAFAFFGLPLMKEALKILNSHGEDIDCVPEMNAKAIDYLLDRGWCICGKHIAKGSVEELNLLREKSKQPPEAIGALVSYYKDQTTDYLAIGDTYFDKLEGRYTDIRSGKRELGHRNDEKEVLDKRLIGQKDSALLEEQYKNSEKHVKTLEVEKEKLLESIGACKKDIQIYEEKLAKYSRLNEKNIRISLNIEYATAVYEWVKDAYSSRESIVRGKLEEKVNENFSRMYHGSRNITIDEKYRVQYYDVTTEESEGLKAVKSFAFVSGLVDLAKEALLTGDEADLGGQYYPLVMDAPFSNVDEIHIRNISEILPKSAEQVVIAVMQKDWEPASVIMQQYVGKSYCIEKDKNADGRYIDTMSHIKEVYHV